MSNLATNAYTVNDTSLDITASLSLEDCGVLIEGLRQGKDKAMWAIADALVYANDKHGDDIYQFLDATNWSQQTIANYMTTARKIPRTARRKGVSFSNHSELTSLDPQQMTYALDMLERKEWSRDDLRQWKRELKGTPENSELEITLQWDGRLVHGLDSIGVRFVKPDDKYKIIGFKAIVIEQPKAQPMERAS